MSNWITLPRLNELRFPQDPVQLVKLQRWCRERVLPARKPGVAGRQSFTLRQFASGEALRLVFETEPRGDRPGAARRTRLPCGRGGPFPVRPLLLLAAGLALALLADSPLATVGGILTFVGALDGLGALARRAERRRLR